MSWAFAIPAASRIACGCREPRPPSSGDHPVLVDEATQTIGSSYPGGVGVADGGRGRIGISGRSLAEGAVGPVRVVMRRTRQGLLGGDGGRG